MAGSPLRGVIDFREASVREFNASMRKMLRELETDLIAYAARFVDSEGKFNASADALAQMSRATATIRQRLRKSGYDSAFEKHLKSMPELRSKVLAAYNDFSPGKRLAFQKPDLDAYRIALGSQFDAYANIGDAGADSLRHALTKAVTTGQSWDSYVGNLKETLRGSGLKDRAGRGMFRHANTLARTATTQLQRQVQAGLDEKMGIERWSYEGPKDDVIRPFCERLVIQSRSGRTWTRKQIDAMDNSKNGGGAGDGPGSAYQDGGVLC
jgi:hypothetical protein